MEIEIFNLNEEKDKIQNKKEKKKDKKNKKKKNIIL